MDWMKAAPLLTDREGWERSCAEVFTEADERRLDRLVGETLLSGVRLDRVQQVRARLLAGKDRDLVSRFPRHDTPAHLR